MEFVELVKTARNAAESLPEIARPRTEAFDDVEAFVERLPFDLSTSRFDLTWDESVVLSWSLFGYALVLEFEGNGRIRWTLLRSLDDEMKTVANGEARFEPARGIPALILDLLGPFVLRDGTPPAHPLRERIWLCDRTFSAVVPCFEHFRKALRYWALQPLGCCAGRLDTMLDALDRAADHLDTYHHVAGAPDFFAVQLSDGVWLGYDCEEETFSWHRDGNFLGSWGRTEAWVPFDEGNACDEQRHD